jgi:phage gpG-like protein
MAFNFEQKIREFQLSKRTLPAIIGNMAKRHFVEGFRKGGFTDITFDPWAERKKKDRVDGNGTNTRAILVKNGHLRRSIRVRVATFSLIEIGAYNIPYAVFHNTGAGKMPKRQFIGESATLNRKIKARINKEFKDILR